MTVLAVDTTAEHGSLVLRQDDRLRGSATLHAPRGFSHQIFGALDALLKDARIPLTEVDLFASASGPGSFTGVRIGLSMMKGLAEATGKCAAGISNLRALSVFGTGTLRAVLADARRGEIYGAVYDSAFRALVPERVAVLASWLDSLEERDYEFISQMDLADLDRTRFARARRIRAPLQLAEAVAICAAHDGGVDPAALDANYVRKSDAELFWREG